VTAVAGIVGAGTAFLGRRTDRASMIPFNHFATHSSSELAAGMKVPSIVSFCEVPGILLWTVSHLGRVFV